MARKRMINPEIWDDEDIGILSPGAFKLFIACISNADDYGKLEASPRYLRGLAFRYDDNITIQKIEEYLDELDKYLRSFLRYEVNGKSYIKLKNWNRWQTIRKPQDSMIPDPVQYQCVTSAAPVQHQCSTDTLPEQNQDVTDVTPVRNQCVTSAAPVQHQCSTSAAPVPPKRKEKNRKEENRSTSEGRGEGEGNKTTAPDDPVLAVLYDIKGYPFDAKTDSSFIAKLKDDFPNADILDVAKQYSAWTLDHPIGKKDSPRARLRNFARNAANRMPTPKPQEPQRLKMTQDDSDKRMKEAVAKDDAEFLMQMKTKGNPDFERIYNALKEKNDLAIKYFEQLQAAKASLGVELVDF